MNENLDKYFSISVIKKQQIGYTCASLSSLNKSSKNDVQIPVDSQGSPERKRFIILQNRGMKPKLNFKIQGVKELDFMKG